MEPILPVIRKEAEERKKRNIPMIDLAKAENVLIRPEVLEIYKKAIVDNLESSHLSYPKGTFGDPVLHTRLADFFNTYFNPAIPVTPDHLVTAPGASTCLDALMFNICNPGDAVLIPGPYWSIPHTQLRHNSLTDRPRRIRFQAPSAFFSRDNPSERRQLLRDIHSEADTRT